MDTERWYDLFSHFYDLNCEHVYWPARVEVARRFGPEGGRTLVDVCCGTGANFPHLAPMTRDGGRLFAMDLSEGMLRKAAARARKLGLSNVTLVRADARRLSDPAFRSEHGLGEEHSVVCTLGLSVVPDWEEVLDAARRLLRPQGHLVVMDGRTLQGRLAFLNPIFVPYIQWMARATIARPIEETVGALTRGDPAARFLFGHIFVTGGALGGQGG